VPFPRVITSTFSRTKRDRFSEKNRWSVCYKKVCILNNICSNYKLVLPDEGTSLYVGMHIIKLYSLFIKLFISKIIKSIFVLTLVKVDATGQRTSFYS